MRSLCVVERLDYIIAEKTLSSMHVFVIGALLEC